MNLSDADFDRVVAGHPGTGPEAGEVARLLNQVNTAYVSPIPAATESRHLNAIRQANQSRPRTGAAAGPGTGLGSVLAPLRELAASLQPWGLVRLSGSTAVWAVVMALFFVGATGGLAAAGVLPDPIQTAVSNAAQTVGIAVPRPGAGIAELRVSDPVPPGTVEVTESDLAAQQAALASAEQAVQAAEQAQRAAAEAAAISAGCLEESMTRVSSLVDQILAATSPAQAQAIVNQARNVGGSVKSCADQAAAAGQAGVGHANLAAELARRANQGGPALSPDGLAAVDAAGMAARAASTSATRAYDLSRSIVDNVGGLTAGMIGSTLNRYEAPAPPPAPLPGVQPQAGPPPVPAAGPAAWGSWGTDYADRIMSSFMGGAGRGR